MVSNVAESILTILYTQAWVLAWLSSLPAFRQCADCPHGSPINTAHLGPHPFSLFSWVSPSEWCRHSFYGLASLLFNAYIFFSATRRYFFFFFFNLDKYLNTISGTSVTLTEGQSLNVAYIFVCLSPHPYMFILLQWLYFCILYFTFPYPHVEII